MILRMFLAICFLSSISLANHDARCIQDRLSDWVKNQKIPLQIKHISHSISRAKVKLHEYNIWKCDLDYDNDGEIDEEYCESNTWHKGEPEMSDRIIQVWGHNPRGNVEFQFAFNSEFLDVEKTVFGSGDVKRDYTCCALGNTITIHDKTSGFSQSFPVGKMGCSEVRRSLKDKASQSNELIKINRSEKLLCKEFGRRIQKWSTKEKNVYVPKHGFVTKYSSHTGCKKLGSPSSNLRWKFSKLTAEIQDSFDRTLKLSCAGPGSDIQLNLQLTKFDDSVLNEMDKSSQHEVSIKTDRSSPYYFNKYSVDLRSKSIAFANTVRQDFLKSIKSDKSLELEMLTSNGSLLKKVSFSLKGSSKAVKALAKACK